MTSIKRMMEMADAKKRAGPGKRPKRDVAKAVASGVETLAKIEELGSTPADRVEAAREIVSQMHEASIKFLMKIDRGMSDWLEQERRRRGLRSRAETIRRILSEARDGEGEGR